MSRKKRYLNSLASGILLSLSYPPFNLGWLAWVALVPLFFAVHSCRSRKQALIAGLFCGLVFFGTSLSWMNHVHVLAWALLVPLEAFFVVLFAGLVYEARQIGSSLFRNIWFALAWTVTEWMRSECPIFGMGWNLLAYSQAPFVWVIQSASFFGAFGLTFAIALVNALVFQLLYEFRYRLGHGKWNLALKGLLPFSVIRPLLVSFVTVILILATLAVYGFGSLKEDFQRGKTVRIGVVQGNIPQNLKWDPRAKGKILEIYDKLTQLVSLEAPDLILWPEASFPGYFFKRFPSSSAA
ncbi:hypothetical protein N9K06_00400 [Omnitrophica bacterium]|nr:hypothetical protein [Candidatus Omnitrophota bacterium]